MYEYLGNLHMHSTYSDGSLDIEDIAARAAQAGLDFIIITDHYTLKGLYEKKEGYQQGVLVMIGMEANVSQNHYICLDISQEVKNNDEYPQEVIDGVNRQDGIGIIAHPFEKGSPVFGDGIKYQWTDWQVQDFQGIEVWNFTSQWKEHVSSIIKGLFLLIYPHAALTGPCPLALQKLDQYQGQGKKIIAVGGSDAHGFKMKAGILWVTVSPYETAFRCINVHVLCPTPLSGQVADDKYKIYHAIRQGQLWIAYDYFINSYGFRFFVEGEGKRWQMGDSLPFSSKLTGWVFTPKPALVKLLRNGIEVESSRGRQHVFYDLEPGVYRVEVYHRHLLGYRPWIFSNAIWIE
ncbi:MAG: CehA/McbA family metallohydrolase [Syntrophomonadaceae bacterium]|nr:CehA/McbA family metallohydrolase [Syntrophomonadaceae bacterium]